MVVVPCASPRLREHFENICSCLLSFNNQQIFLGPHAFLDTGTFLETASEQNNRLMNHTTVDGVEYLFSSEQVGEAPGDPV